MLWSEFGFWLIWFLSKFIQSKKYKQDKALKSWVKVRKTADIESL